MTTTKLDSSTSIWEHFFSVYPLVLIGSRDPEGSYDLAPKHMAMPVSWNNHFGFVCAPHHRTYQNIRDRHEFTVSYPRPSQIVLTSLAADPRTEDDTKPALKVLPTFKAENIDGVFIEDAYLFLECRLEKIVDNIGGNNLIIGEVVAAQVDNEFIRIVERDDQELIHASPLLAYLYPGRFAKIEQSFSFPFPKGFSR
ncbi:flavin reductase family protein [Nitrosomonas aestuarii]|uniref:flavin reductase family protein n=1 Tax=Nitrosomonas aestuarii TaxID=52441 RepID=UPI000D30B9EF|nr:flavin reductase [Nitrosomonas aestuarii]PTN11813.1 flavin reductase (DIM6/NTAB) family NADH-FMN oxidoreductase RutF [Nitrosomonas aestuarii]